ncbi:ribosomal L7Ae/L30e/S12e/Gadd45 family protein, partial [Staphylococcus epidermidis]|uniref:50S ribosomal protein L7ae-like protein n=1 Tax=Staphylococcus epidermidis TaxID=1282 RepID=UPI0011A853E7
MSNQKLPPFNKQQYLLPLKQTLKPLNKPQLTSFIIPQHLQLHFLTPLLTYINHKNIPLSFFSTQPPLPKYVPINLNAT